jgi:hypothetical protein
VIGKDIPPISLNKSKKDLNVGKGKTKSGVDVFCEERSRDERSKYLNFLFKRSRIFSCLYDLP